MILIGDIEEPQPKELGLQMLDLLQSEAWGAIVALVLQPRYDEIIAKLHDGVQPSEREAGNCEIIMRLDEFEGQIEDALKPSTTQ